MSILIGFDAWKTRPPADWPSGDGRPDRKLGRCTICAAFRGTAIQTIQHSSQTGHPVIWRGVPQRGPHDHA